MHRCKSHMLFLSFFCYGSELLKKRTSGKSPGTELASAMLYKADSRALFRGIATSADVKIHRTLPEVRSGKLNYACGVVHVPAPVLLCC